MAERHIAHPTGSVNPLQREAALLGLADPLLSTTESTQVRAAFAAIVAVTLERYPLLAQGAPNSRYFGNEGGLYDRLGEAAALPAGSDSRDAKLAGIFGLLDLTNVEAEDIIPHPRAFRR